MNARRISFSMASIDAITFLLLNRERHAASSHSPNAAQTGQSRLLGVNQRAIAAIKAMTKAMLRSAAECPTGRMARKMAPPVIPSADHRRREPAFPLTKFVLLDAAAGRALPGAGTGICAT